MSIAYLILAHNNPCHFRQLLCALASPTSEFFVHIDKKTKVDFTHELSADVVHFVTNRIEVHWGDFSLVEATLALINQALHNPRNFDRIVLLSGADYPVRSASYIETFFKTYCDTEFINVVKMPSEAAGKPLYRLTLYWHNANETLIKSATRRLLCKLRLIPRERNFKKALSGLTPYAGSQWWALTRGACEYIEQFCSANPKIVNFFRNTLVPDEMFFQTVIGNSPFKEKLRRNLTFTDWSAGGPNPALLSDEHVDTFASATCFGPDRFYGDGEILFARKFSDKRQDVVASITRLVQERDG